MAKYELGDVAQLVVMSPDERSVTLPDGVSAKAFSGTQYNIFWKGRAFVQVQPLQKAKNEAGEDVYDDRGCWKVCIPFSQCRVVLKDRE